MRSAQDDADLTALISTIKSETDGDSVSLGDLKDALGSRAFGPLVVIVALIAVLPTGAIPGMSLITGSVMLIVSAQLLIGSATIWLPRQLSERAISRDRLVGSL
ncbi:MAG: exopolysaccharide biosynthesis protein, partial [Pseudomonadota bacterium]